MRLERVVEFDVTPYLEARLKELGVDRSEVLSVALDYSPAMQTQNFVIRLRPSDLAAHLPVFDD